LIVEKLRIELKNTKILILGILPQGSEERNKRIKHINTMISEFKDNNYIHFLDMWSHFFDANGKFNSKLFASDTVHPNIEGYQVWANAMEPMFEKLLNNTKGFQ
jgi:beta-glucosidase